LFLTQARRLAAKAAAKGYNALAFQQDYSVPASISRGLLWTLFADACLAAGILPGVWATQPVNGLAAPHDARFVVVEDERPDQRSFILANIDRFKALRVPLGVVTNGHYDPSIDVESNREEWAPIADAGFAYLGEVYARTDAGEPTGQRLVDMQYRAGVWQGVEAAKTAPVYGQFGGALYDPAERASQQAYWDWPVEGVLVNA
jgi:hypothetical protein